VATKRGQHAVLDGGLVREALRQLGAPAFQQLDDAGRPAAMAVRAGRLQQLGHVVADGLGVARRLLRQRALVQRQRQAAAQRRQHQRGGQRQCPVAAQPQPGAVLPVLAPHADRLRRQVALQVLDEGADAGVALAGLLAQRLGAHRLQVAQRGRRVGRTAAAFAAFGQAQQLGEARRLAVQHGVLKLGARQLAGALRQKAGEQLEQHDAQRVLVGAGADGLAGHLLGRRVGRRQARAGPGRQLAVGPRGVGVEQGGDAEVEQLGGAVRADDDVGGLEVAVHHQLRVRRLHGLRHVHQQAHASGHRQLPLAHMRRQGLAGHELQHQVGAVAGVDASVEQLRHAGVAQAAEQSSLAREALAQLLTTELGTQQLDGGHRLVEAVGAVRAPHLAHATLAQQGLELPGTEARAAAQRGLGVCCARCALCVRCVRCVGTVRSVRFMAERRRDRLAQPRHRGRGAAGLDGQHAPQALDQARVVALKAGQPVLARLGAERLAGVVQGRQAGPVDAFLHSISASSARALASSRCTVRRLTPRSSATSAGSSPAKPTWSSSSASGGSRRRSCSSASPTATRSSGWSAALGRPSACDSVTQTESAPPRLSRWRARSWSMTTERSTWPT
jgi:hypothetical protein